MQNDYKTEIIKLKGDWREVVDDCRSTVGKLVLVKIHLKISEGKY